MLRRAEKSRNDANALDHATAPLLEQALEQVDIASDPIHVGIDLQRATRILECAVVILESNEDQSVAGERAKVVRVALHDLVAVGERLAQLAGKKIQGSALVPAFGEIGLEFDDAGKGDDTLLQVAGIHLLDTRLVEPVHFRVAGAGPDTP